MSVRLVGSAVLCLAGTAVLAYPIAARPASPLRHAQAAQTAPATYTDTIPGTSVSFEMVALPGGTFEMGSPPGEVGRGADEGPRHSVTVEPLWVGKYEVTWDEYERFAFGAAVPAPQVQSGSTGLVTRPTPPYGDESFGFGKGRQPVINITHHAAMEYTRWLSQATGKVYRLPTEAEWEYFGRAGSADAYPFGGDVSRLGDVAWYATNAKGRPHPVGSKGPNAFGLFDTLGNVAEWCLDRYDPQFYARSQAKAPVVLPSDRRYPDVTRGGSWADEPALLRSAARRPSTEAWSRRDPQRPQSIWWHTDATIVGFRIVRAVEEDPALRDVRSTVTRDSENR
ncbi:MAG: formylglycine-generating enzyme family protein [Acidobacteriota bacterium]|nr:formylglycine-generating enzyme family protein [Acidobacteriota bacterium]